MIRPYNGSIFEIRGNYSEVFEDLAKDLKHQVEARNDTTHQIYKIKYTINLLPCMDVDDNLSLMDLMGDTDLIEIFQTKAV